MSQDKGRDEGSLFFVLGTDVVIKERLVWREAEWWGWGNEGVSVSNKSSNGMMTTVMA